MPSLRKLFSQYTGSLRSIKLVYVINNWLNARKLKHNKALYEKYGVDKSIYSSLSSKDFKEHHHDIPWLDQEDGREKLLAHPYYKSLSEDWRNALLNFVDNGFLVLKGFYNQQQVDALNQEIARLKASTETHIDFSGKKIMDAFRVSPIVEEYFRNPQILELMNFILGKEVIPFQTLNFIEGSEQKAHSDSIHMTTEPQGYLLASWTALESTNLDNGVLFYYPKSHRLPYVTTEHYDSGNTEWILGDKSYANYEAYIEGLVTNHGFEKHFFFAQPGDVLFWHANLIHGGSIIKKKGASRRSMVSHYFCKDVICYHELSQRPALLE